AVALGSEEHAIVAALDHFGEVGIELDHRAPSLELRGAEILEPQLRALHAIERALRAVRKRHRRALCAHHRQIAGNDHVALEKAGKGVWVGGFTDDACVAAGETVDAHERVRRADQAGALAGGADDAGDGRDIHAYRRSLGGGDAGDAPERTRGTVNAGAEERRRADRGAPEVGAPYAARPPRATDDARLDEPGAVNPADELRGMLRRLHGALNAIRVTQSSQTDIEDGLAFVNDKGVETGEGVSEGDEKVIKGTHWLNRARRLRA